MKTIKKTMNKNNGLSARYGYENDNIKVELEKAKVATGCYVWNIYVEDYKSREGYIEHKNSFKAAKKHALELINKYSKRTVAR